MIRFRSLGGLDLQGPDGKSLQAVIAQPKRQALLAYLALATPHGFHRRDSLLALFWPDQDEARARAALNRAVHFLRLSIGADTLVSRGHEELGLDWQQFWCDATGFEEALDRGAPAEAIALYRGDLLPGFHIDEASTFENWLESRRAQLRDRAVQAALQLSEQEEAAGNLVAAVDWARRTVTLAPFDEAGVRRLMQALDRGADRAGALRAFDELSHRLTRELDVEPAPETANLASEIRARDVARDFMPVAISEVSAAPVAAAVAAPRAGPPAAPSTVPPRPPPRRPRRRLVVAGTILAGCAAALLLVRGLRDRAHARTSRAVTVAIPPLEVNGVPGGDSLARMLIHQLSSDLERDGTMRVVRDRAAARYSLAGHLDGDENHIHVMLALLDSAGNQPEPRAAMDGDVDQLNEMAADLAYQLALAQPGSGRTILPTFPTTLAVRALDAYREGLTQRDAGRFAQAAVSFRRSIDADTNFALSYYQLSRVANWTGEWETASWAISGAMRHRESVALADQFRIQAWAAFEQGDPKNAERSIRAALAYVNDADAWFTLGEVLFHWGTELGWTPEQADAAFARSLAFQSTNVDALMHRARLAALDDSVKLDSLVTSSERLPLDPGQALELQTLRAFTSGTAADRDRVVKAAESLDDRRLSSLVSWASVYASRPDRARLAGLLRAPRRAANFRAVASLMNAQIAMSHGRWSEAAARLDSAKELSPERADEYRAALAILPFVHRPAAEVRALRDRLATKDRAAEISAGTEAVSAAGIYPPRYYYSLAMLSLRLNDRASAERYLATLDDRSRPPDANFLAHGAMARIVRAEMLHTAGHDAQALEALGPQQVLPSSVLPSVVDYPQAYERFLRAELLHATGHDRQALRWYSTFPDPGGSDLAYLAPSLVRRAEIQERLGLAAAARINRARAAARWRDADADVAATRQRSS